MPSIESAELELQRAVGEAATAHPARLRVRARRAAGMAAAAYFHDSTANFPDTLRRFMTDPAIPPDVRNAAARLQERLTPDFRSASADPVGDASIIVHFVKGRLKEGGRN